MISSRITFLLPTCEPDTMRNILLPTISQLKSIKDIIEFNICFQPPYTEDIIQEVLAEFQKNEFKVNWIFKDYKVVRPYTPLIKMRNDCAMLSPKSDVYGLMDDDFSIQSDKAADYIKSVIDMFNADPNLGVISFFNQPVQNWRENFYSTNSGLFYRGGSYYGFDGLMPESLASFKGIKILRDYDNENLLELFGGFQDKFCAMCRLATGQEGISIYNIPINHVENRKEKGAISHGWDNAKFQQGSIAQFIQKYFNPIFLQTHSLTLFHPALNKVIYPSHYDENGNLKAPYNEYLPNGIKKVFYEEYFTTYAPYHLPVLVQDNGKWENK